MDGIFVLVTVGIGVILLGISVSIIIRRLKFTSRTERTKVRIVDYECNPSDVGRRFYPIFEFDFDGEKTLIESEFGFNPPVGMIGDNVYVLYNPDKPSECLIPIFSALWGTGVFIASMGIAIILCGIIFGGV
jgi:hypothetical protein